MDNEISAEEWIQRCFASISNVDEFVNNVSPGWQAQFETAEEAAEYLFLHGSIFEIFRWTSENGPKDVVQ